jgi:hypothetical protein
LQVYGLIVIRAETADNLDNQLIMAYKIPARLLGSKSRRVMWQNAEAIVKKLEKMMPISEAHLLGSFASKKRRPADVDFIILLKTKVRTKENWSVDLVLAPDNKYGKLVLADAAKWVGQKYGRKNSAVIRIK